MSEQPTNSGPVFSRPAEEASRGRLAPGRRWGKFLIEEVLGAGGHAFVYQAYDQLGVAGHVALKVPRGPVAAEAVRDWLAREAKPLTKLAHPHIVAVVDAGCIEGVPYVATALTDALPLGEHVKAHPPALGEVAAWSAELADAVQAAHARGIVHRDLKPANVLVDPSAGPRIIDFGIAAVSGAYGSTGAPPGAGTPAFIAPEQARGEAGADHRVDVFGLGALLKFLLDGSGPYARAGEPLAAARAGQVVLADASIGPPLRRALARVANRALSPRPVDRHATAGEMAKALRRLGGRRRWPLPAAAGLAVAAALLAWLVLRGPAGGSAELPRALLDRPAGQALKVAYGRSPPAGPTGTAPRPRMSLEIFARREGQAEFARLADGEAMASEADEYLIAVRPMTAGWLYVFQIDSNGNAFWLFPANRACAVSTGRNPVAGGSVVQIPSEQADRVLFLDRRTGVEHVYAVFSAERWPELERALGPAETPTSSTAVVAGPPGAGLIGRPNGMRLRGVGGVRPAQTVTVQRLHGRRRVKLALTGPAWEASGSFLVVERWFRHVGAAGRR